MNVIAAYVILFLCNYVKMTWDCERARWSFLRFTAPYIKVCSRNDPEINKCITNSIEQLRDKLTAGIPELDVPSIEPLLLDNLQLSRGPNSASLNANFTNIQVGINTCINGSLFGTRLMRDAQIWVYPSQGCWHIHVRLDTFNSSFLIRASSIKYNELYYE